MNKNKRHFIWAEKYRPQTIDECILPPSLKELIKSHITDGQVPHLLLTGHPGTGKTTLAKALCNDIESESMLINGSNEGRQIDTLRTDVERFASTVSFTGKPKVIIIDEADYMTTLVQNALRSEIEKFSRSCRFILTGNQRQKIIPPLQSRLVAIDFNDNKELPKLAAEFFKRAAVILKEENVDFDKKVLINVINKLMPDWRRILNQLQHHSKDGKLSQTILSSGSFADGSFEDLLSAMKKQDFTEIRKWVAENSQTVDTTALVRKFFDKMDVFEVSSRAQLVLFLNDCQYKAAFVTDHEINIMDLLVNISAELKWEK